MKKIKENKTILVIAAHPDDEVLGCGGTIARLIKEGFEVYTLILGEGITSRDDMRDRKRREEEITELKGEAKEANKILGVKEVFFYDFPDNRFDTVPFLDIVKVVEKVKNSINPEIIFTHYEMDLNVDHQITYRAVITATRPLKEESVKEIYSFEIPSSTEWRYPLNFSPDVFFDISTTIDIKIKALEKYKTELKKYPHPRSLEGVKLIAKNWGIKVGLEYAEAFKVVRILK
ncbi:MAG: PIG-L family deacetylase [Candidatus Omnitrophota bacterium]|nr:MAG: PIG-L family deacetylase [Candidatus Omnitrophota bacterium]